MKYLHLYSISFLQHSMIYFFHHYELPNILSQAARVTLEGNVTITTEMRRTATPAAPTAAPTSAASSSPSTAPDAAAVASSIHPTPSSSSSSSTSSAANQTASHPPAARLIAGTNIVPNIELTPVSTSSSGCSGDPACHPQMTEESTAGSVLLHNPTCSSSAGSNSGQDADDGSFARQRRSTAADLQSKPVMPCSQKGGEADESCSSLQSTNGEERNDMDDGSA